MLRRHFFKVLSAALAAVCAAPLLRRFAAPEVVSAAERVAASEEMCLSSYDWPAMSPSMVSERSKLFGISEADVEALIANQQERHLADQLDRSDAEAVAVAGAGSAAAS